MIQSICHNILFKRWGWTKEVTVPLRDKCIIAVAPHTSNWDFIIGELYYQSMGRKALFLMKKSWFFFPLGILLRKLGGFPVNRSKRTSMTEQMAESAKHTAQFELAVTPEGTRSRRTKWKHGFYFMALKAGLPIQLYAIDYKNKRIVCTEEIIPTGNLKEDMQKINNYYEPFLSLAKYPEKFALDDISEL